MILPLHWACVSFMFTIVITPVILCRRLGMEAVSDPWLHVRPNFRSDLGDLLEESDGLVLRSSWNLLVLNVVTRQDVVSRKSLSRILKNFT